MRGVLVLSLALGACASPGFNYLPETASGTANTASYDEPPANPQGHVRLRSAGIVDLRAKGGHTRIPALHIRMTVENTNAPTKWSVDTREQTVSFAGHGDIRPTYANSNADGMPQIQIEPGATRAIDLYFALPDRSASAKNLPEFDMRWKVASFSGDTQFVRVSTAPPAVAPAPVEPYPVGYGPYWYDSWGPPMMFAPAGPAIRVRN